MDIQSFLDNLIFVVLLLTTIIYWAGLIYTNLKFLIKLSFNGILVANAPVRQDDLPIRSRPGLVLKALLLSAMQEGTREPRY